MISNTNIDNVSPRFQCPENTTMRQCGQSTQWALCCVAESFLKKKTDPDNLTFKHQIICSVLVRCGCTNRMCFFLICTGHSGSRNLWQKLCKRKASDRRPPRWSHSQNASNTDEVTWLRRWGLHERRCSGLTNLLLQCSYIWASLMTRDFKNELQTVFLNNA